MQRSFRVSENGTEDGTLIQPSPVPMNASTETGELRDTCTHSLACHEVGLVEASSTNELEEILTNYEQPEMDPDFLGHEWVMVDASSLPVLHQRTQNVRLQIVATKLVEVQGALVAAPTSLWSFAASHQGTVFGAAKRIGEMGSALYEKIKISFDGLDALQQMVQAHTVLNQLSSMVESAAMSASSVLAAPALAEKDSTIETVRRDLVTAMNTVIAEREQCRQELAAVQSMHAESAGMYNAELECRWANEHDQLEHLKSSERAEAAAKEKLKFEFELARKAQDDETGMLTRRLAEMECKQMDERERMANESECAKQAHLEECKQLRRDLNALQSAFSEERACIENALQEAVAQKEADSRQLNEELHTANMALEANDLNRCCICMDFDRQVLFLPCKHVCCCMECAVGLQLCPIDRTPITECVKFTMA